MAFTQFPHQQYFRVLDTDTNTRLGYFNLDDGTEIKHMMLTIFLKQIPAAFTLRVNIYGNDTLDTPIFSSDYATISATTLGSTLGNNWLGNIYLDFSGYSLNPNIDYYITVQTVGYTRNVDTSYLGINLDWYSPVNNQLTVNEAGARMRILGSR